MPLGHGRTELRVTSAGEIDLRSAQATAEPFPLLRNLRESDPVHWSPRHNAWLLTRYEDVRGALKDPQFAVKPLPPVAGDPNRNLFNLFVVFTDPPAHTRLRRAIRAALTQAAIEKVRAHTTTIVNAMIDDLPAAETTDLVRRCTFPLPAMVLAELLGVPSEDRAEWLGWSYEITELLAVSGGRDRVKTGLHGLNNLREYFRRQADRCSVGQQVERRDAAQQLVRTEGEGEGLVSALVFHGKLDRDEIVATALALLFAGHETTSSLMAAGVLALLKHPSQRQRLQREPGLIVSAVEEILRYAPPAKAIMRFVKTDLEIGGRRLRSGDRTWLSLAAANRDPSQFPDPDALDIGRHPNPHLSLGGGIHVCLGAPLARLESAIFLETLLRRRPALRLAGPPSRVRTLVGGLGTLPVVLGPDSTANIDGQ